MVDPMAQAGSEACAFFATVGRVMAAVGARPAAVGAHGIGPNHSKSRAGSEGPQVSQSVKVHLSPKTPPQHPSIHRSTPVRRSTASPEVRSQKRDPPDVTSRVPVQICPNS